MTGPLPPYCASSGKWFLKQCGLVLIVVPGTVLSCPRIFDDHLPRTWRKVVVRMCDHIVVWAVQGLVRAAVAAKAPLDQGQLLRIRACREILSEALRACSGRGQDEGVPEGPGGGGGMYQRRLGFLDDIILLLTVPQEELEGECLSCRLPTPRNKMMHQGVW